MTRDEAAQITAELNIFGDGWHLKLEGVPVVSAPKLLRETREALEKQGLPTSGNGHQSRQEARQPSQAPSAVAEPSCPVHGPKRVKPSKFGAGWYCTAKQGDSYCAWTQQEPE